MIKYEEGDVLLTPAITHGASPLIGVVKKDKQGILHTVLRGVDTLGIVLDKIPEDTQVLGNSLKNPYYRKFIETYKLGD